MSVKKRLKDFIKSQGLTISGFEKDINVSNGYVNSISKGIGGEVLLSILEKSPKLNIDWLLTGKGSMLKEDTSKPVNTPEDMGQVALLQQENSFLKEKITLLEENKILQAKEIKRGRRDKKNKKIIFSFLILNAIKTLTIPNVEERQHNKSVANSVAPSVANQKYKKGNTNEEINEEENEEKRKVKKCPQIK